MLKITSNNIEYNIPTSWDDLSTEKYIKLTNMISLFRNEEGDITLDQEALFQKITTTITELKHKDLMDIEMTAVMAIKAALAFLNTPMPEPKSKGMLTYKNYVLKLNSFDKLTFGQFADIQQLLINGENDTTKMLAKIIDVYEKGTWYKKHKKLDLTNEQKQKMLNEMSCVEYNNISFFLLRKMVKYMKTSQHSLNRMALRMNAGLIFRSLGVIIRLSYCWLTIKLTRSKKQLISH